MKTTVLLIRHGKTEWNESGRIQGCEDIDLTEEGLLQAEALKERLQNSFDNIYSSPLIRAHRTAKILAEYNKKELFLVEGLKEVHYGNWQGLTHKEIKNNYPELYHKWHNGLEECPISGGELSIGNAVLRAKKSILEIVSQNKGSTIAIVAHGGIIKAALIGIFSFNFNMYHRIAMDNTSITKLVFDEYLNPFLLTLNDTSHLK